MTLENAIRKAVTDGLLPRFWTTQHLLALGAISHDFELSTLQTDPLNRSISVCKTAYGNPVKNGTKPIYFRFAPENNDRPHHPHWFCLIEHYQEGDPKEYSQPFAPELLAGSLNVAIQRSTSSTLADFEGTRDDKRLADLGRSHLDGMLGTPAPSGDVRFPILLALSWRWVVELLRRYQQSHALRVFETHPGGGQYDCLALHTGKQGFGEEVCSFNRVGSLHVVGSFDRVGHLRPQHATLPMSLRKLAGESLTANDPSEIVDRVADCLGLPKVQVPASTPAILMFRLIAEVLERRALGRQPLDARWAVCDASDGVDVRSAFWRFPGAAPLIDPEQAKNDPYGTVAPRFWLLVHYGSGEPAALFDLRGVVHFPDSSAAWQAYADYDAFDRKFGRLVAELESRIS